jgi:histidine triad (HIT) family protein
MDECIFCRIAAGQIPTAKVLENDQFVAFRDINPKAPQHVLVIPREHLVSIDDLSAWQHCEGHALLEFIAEAAREVGIADTGYRVISNIGPDGAQEIQHMHFHILGGEYLGDLR